MTSSSIKVGISSCLLGQSVRYDGGHKRSALCIDELAQLFEFVPTCPEAGAGLGVPRPAVHLVGAPDAPRARGISDPALDVTERLQAYAGERVPQLTDLCGYVFIRNSPSCGLHDVKLYADDGRLLEATSRGIFAAAFVSAYPLLPVEEEGRLHEARVRENFITRVYALHEWKQLRRGGLSAAALTQFHGRYKYTLMAQSLAHYRTLGRMLATAGTDALEPLAERYFIALMDGLQKFATRGTHANVLMHLQGYLKKQLTPADKQELGDLIDRYRRGLVPLAAPVRLLRRHFAEYPDPYIAQQAYLQPRTDAAREEVVP
ncbi:MAG: YbgA family protein [Gammaproteobacteria bacterium]